MFCVIINYFSPFIFSLKTRADARNRTKIDSIMAARMKTEVRCSSIVDRAR